MDINTELVLGQSEARITRSFLKIPCQKYHWRTCCCQFWLTSVTDNLERGQVPKNPIITFSENHWLSGGKDNIDNISEPDTQHTLIHSQYFGQIDFWERAITDICLISNYKSAISCLSPIINGYRPSFCRKILTSHKKLESRSPTEGSPLFIIFLASK